VYTAQRLKRRSIRTRFITIIHRLSAFSYKVHLWGAEGPTFSFHFVLLILSVGLRRDLYYGELFRVTFLLGSSRFFQWVSLRSDQSKENNRSNGGGYSAACTAH
jgi:hypothetical protein